MTKECDQGFEHERRSDDPLKSKDERAHELGQRERDCHGYRYQGQGYRQDGVLRARNGRNGPRARQGAPGNEEARRGWKATQRQRAPGGTEEHHERHKQDQHRNKRANVPEDATNAFAGKADKEHRSNRVAHHARAQGVITTSPHGIAHSARLIRHTRNSKRGGSGLLATPAS